MEQQVTATETRAELLARLAEARASGDGLSGLVEFLRDDLAFTPDNQTIIGMVLRESEFGAWRELMISVRWDAPGPIDYNANEVRAHSQKLLADMSVECPLSTHCGHKLGA